MRHTLAKLFSLIIVLSTLIVEYAPCSATAQQRDDRLDQPLPHANTRGANDPDETQFIIDNNHRIDRGLKGLNATLAAMTDTALSTRALTPSAIQTDVPTSGRGWWYLLLLALAVLGVVSWRAYTRWAADIAARDEQQRTARARSAARRALARGEVPTSKSDEDVLRELLDLQGEEVKR